MKFVLKQPPGEPGPGTDPEPEPNATVLDNASPHFTTTGSWSAVTATSSVYGSDYMATSSSSPLNTAQWDIPDDIAPGKYDLYMMWNGGGDRAAQVPLEIKFDLGLDSAKTVNQQTNGSQWNLIGTYYFSPEYGQYIKLIGSGNGVTVADAIKLVFKEGSPPTSAPAPIYAMPSSVGDELLIDNTDPRFSTVGSGWASTTAGGAFEGTNFMKLTDTAPNQANAATWSTSNIQTAGKYDVYMKWPSAAERPAAAPVLVKSADGTEIYSAANSNYQVDLSGFVNQREHGGEWNYLGAYTFNSGKSYFVKVTGGEGGELAADAVKFVLKQKTSVSEPYPEPKHEGVIKVAIVQDNLGNYSLTRGGQPFFIKGVAGAEDVDVIAERGGNALRTYNHTALNGWEILDRAYEQGVGVMIGLWFVQNGDGIDYSNPADKAKITAQLEDFKQVVLKYKDHPAVIAWALGNETDKGNMDVYYTINELAKFVHDHDPNHPTVSVLAGSSPTKVKGVKDNAPNIDILGINTYIHIDNVYENVVNQGGWTGPYLITEFGPDASYEVKKVNGIAPIELDSGPKSSLIYSRYMDYIIGHPDKVVGSYVFKIAEVIGNTHTWYNLQLENTKKTPLFDEISRAWTGAYPTNQAPRVSDMKLSGGAYEDLKLDPALARDVLLQPGERFTMAAAVTDAEQDSLTFAWEIRYEYKADATSKPGQLIPDTLFEPNPEDEHSMSFYAPVKPGDYRVFLYVYDGHNNVGTANFPFRVQP